MAQATIRCSDLQMFLWRSGLERAASCESIIPSRSRGYAWREVLVGWRLDETFSKHVRSFTTLISLICGKSLSTNPELLWHLFECLFHRNSFHVLTWWHVEDQSLRIIWSHLFGLCLWLGDRIPGLPFAERSSGGKVPLLERAPEPLLGKARILEAVYHQQHVYNCDTQIEPWITSSTHWNQ